MMQQYQRLRASVPADTLLLFRLGDFYELFFEDAKIASGLLNLALTKRNDVPMCGMPYHAAPGYIAKLISAGRRVAICDQTSAPQQGRIVTRDITQIITAGTVSDLDLLESKRANYLGAVFFDDGVFGFAYADLSTGEFRLMQVADARSLLDELARVSPSELLISDRQEDQFGEFDRALSYDHYAFLPENARFTLCEHFKVKSLDGFGCSNLPQAIAAAGAIIHYLKHQLRRKIDHLSVPALRHAVRSRGARCCDPGQPGTGRLARRARYELARGHRPDCYPDGWAETAHLDFAADPRSCGTRGTSAIHRRSPAGAGRARVAARCLASDPRPRARLRATKPGVGKRAGPDRTKSFPPADSRAQARAADSPRPARIWRKSHAGIVRNRIARGASAERTARDAGAGGEVGPRPGRRLPRSRSRRAGFSAMASTRTSTSCDRPRATGKTGSPNCRSGKSRAPGSSPSRCVSIRSLAISSRSPSRISPVSRPITRASRPLSAASASSRPS